MILDTTFIIDAMRKKEEALIKHEELKKRNEVMIITTPSIFEIYSGLVRSNKPEEEKNKILNILSRQIVISLNKSSAEKGGQIHGKLIKEGNPIEDIDCMIAGIALDKNEKVLTRNIKHFEKIHDLELETY